MKSPRRSESLLGRTFHTVQVVSLDSFMIQSLTAQTSPAVKGVKQPSPRLTYSLPLHPDIIGGFFIMQPVNKLVVQRTWGLQQARLTDSEDDSEARALSYGPNFTYDEFLEQGSHFFAAVLTLILALVGVLLSVPPVSSPYF
jgi:hypothetical protein